MNQEKIAKFIKEIRKQNNLTQKELADKLGVTYQAVSKWENGKNLPDISLIKQLSRDYNVSIDDILDGEYNSKKQGNNKLMVILIIVIALLLVFVITMLINNKQDFEFKTISTSCDNFSISGSMAYNKVKSSIYISNINYCGGEDNEKYINIKCGLYEKKGNIEIKINSYSYNSKEEITLEKFLKHITFKEDNYSKMCSKYDSDNLYLKIEAKKKDSDKITTYKIPLKIIEES